MNRTRKYSLIALCSLLAAISFVAVGCKLLQTKRPLSAEVGERGYRVALLAISNEQLATELPWDLAGEIAEKAMAKMKGGVDLLRDSKRAEGCRYLILVEPTAHESDEKQLRMAAKVTILEGESGEVLAESIVEEKHYLPYADRLINYSKLWRRGSDYLHTPLAVAHGRFGKQLAERVEEHLDKLEA